MKSEIFNKSQLKVIKKGFESGLVLEQISIYDKPEYNSRQNELTQNRP